jgi:integrase
MLAPGLPAGVLAAHLTYRRQQGHSEGTIEARRYALQRMAARIPVPLLDATPADLLAWRASLTVTGNTVKGYVAAAHSFYDWAVREGLRADNPADGLPVPRGVRGLPRPISEEALMDAVTTAPPRVRPWLTLAAWAGFRACEIARLRRESVLDTASPPVLLVASDATKGHHERVVPMSAFVLAELRVAGLPRAGWVFPRYDGKRGCNSPAVISHVANAHLHACGANATLHQLRHRFLTMAYRASKDLRLVQDLAGHASPSSTAGYAAYDRESAVVIVEAIPVPGRLRSVPLEEAN